MTVRQERGSLEAQSRALLSLLAETRDQLELRERAAFVEIALHHLAREAADVAAEEWAAANPGSVDDAASTVIPVGAFRGATIAERAAMPNGEKWLAYILMRHLDAAGASVPPRGRRIREASLSGVVASLASTGGSLASLPSGWQRPV